MLWPLQDTAWTASARWFWVMIIAFTAVRLTLVALGIPRARIRLFQEPLPAGFPSSTPTGHATSGNRDPDIEMVESDGGGRQVDLAQDG